MSNADDFHVRTREVVKSFLHTAVVLDDLAVMSPSGGTLENPPVPSRLATPDYPVPSSHSDIGTPITPSGASLDANAVVTGFANIGSVCAVLGTAPGDDFPEITVKAARRADVVILDWKIGDSFGDRALDVMRKILQDDSHSRRLRLIAIYTGELKLEEICETIQGAIAEFYEDDTLETERFRMSKGPLHVVVLAKEHTLRGLPSEFRNQEVSELRLADRLVDEFARMTGGLLRNVAIDGISAIRSNAHRILAKFDQNLDPAYLGHRLLLPHPPDSEDHLAEALGFELYSVIEEERPGAHADVTVIEKWLAMRENRGLVLSQPFAFPGQRSPIEGWRELLLQGLDSPCAQLPERTTKAALRKCATEPFANDSDAAMRSNRRFAALLSLKTRYPGRPPQLSIGTLLCTRECDENRYFLCLQPKCDSVRLRASTGFPLIPLLRLKDVVVGSGETSLRLVVETEKDQWEHFGIESKPSELSVRFFKPGPNPPGVVVASKEQDGSSFFEDVGGQKYRWMAEMKDEHALAVAGEIASALGRPGPNDTEWLRRASGSSP